MFQLYENAIISFELDDKMFLSISCNPATTSSSYLICIELSFLYESWRHVLGLDLLLGQVVLVLVEEMLVLNLLKVTWAKWITFLSF